MPERIGPQNTDPPLGYPREKENIRENEGSVKKVLPLPREKPIPKKFTAEIRRGERGRARASRFSTSWPAMVSDPSALRPIDQFP